MIERITSYEKRRLQAEESIADSLKTLIEILKPPDGAKHESQMSQALREIMEMRRQIGVEK